MKKFLPYRFLFLISALFSITPFNILYGQHKEETGIPPIRNYSPKEYNAAAQNWALEFNLLITSSAFEILSEI